MAAYLGTEGWCLELELRKGSQHSQEGFISFIERVIEKARSLTSRKILSRRSAKGATMRWIHALPRAIARNFPKV